MVCAAVLASAPRVDTTSEGALILYNKGCLILFIIIRLACEMSLGYMGVIYKTPRFARLSTVHHEDHPPISSILPLMR